MKKLFISTACFFLVHSCFSQAVFISKAKIEFERQINMWANIKGDFSEQIKKAIPQFKTDYFNFEFDGEQSIYKPGKEVAVKSGFFGGTPASDNIVYSNYNTGKFVAQKSVFEKTFLLQDSLRNAKWKITNDFREIAGFNCRRATTIIMDSVFVVAFYTDEIMIPGGPESFGNLPGMILGLVINRVHTTWYATKVELTGVDPNKIIPPTKGNKISVLELDKTLKTSFSNWGKNADIFAWWVML